MNENKKKLWKYLLLALVESIAGWLVFSLYISATDKIGYGAALVGKRGLIFLGVIFVATIIGAIIRYNKEKKSE